MSKLDLAVQRGCRLLLAASARFEPLPANFVLHDIPEASLVKKLATLNSGLAALNMQAVMFTRGSGRFLLPVRKEAAEAVRAGLGGAGPEPTRQSTQRGEDAARPSSLVDTLPPAGAGRSSLPVLSQPLLSQEPGAEHQETPQAVMPGVAAATHTQCVETPEYASWIGSLREEVASDYGLVAVAKAAGKDESRRDFMCPELSAYFGAYFVVRMLIHLGNCEIRQQDLLERLSESVLAPSHALTRLLSLEYAAMDPAARVAVWSDDLKWYSFRGLITLEEGEATKVSACGSAAQALLPEYDLILSLAKLRPPSEVSDEQYVSERLKKYGDMVALQKG